MAYESIKHILRSDKRDYSVEVRGWIRTKRASKNMVFLELNDGSCLKNLQVVVSDDNPVFAQTGMLHTGSSVRVFGTIQDSPAKGQAVELRPESVSVYGAADPDTYPLQKKRHSWEFLRSIAHLRVRTNTFGSIFRLRDGLSRAIHTYFWQHDFVYVHPPIITASDCEGAGEMFRVTTLDLAGVPKTAAGEVDFGKDFFGKKAGLTVSGQLEAEIMALGLGKVYTFAPVFRAENSNTSRHLSELWMVEPEMAFFDLSDTMDLAEDFLKQIVLRTMEAYPDEYTLFNRFIQKGLIEDLQHWTNRSFVRMTYDEAIAILERDQQAFTFPVAWGMDLQSEHEKHLCSHAGGPVIVYNYPKDIKPFYMRLNDDDRTVAAMDVLLPRIGEIVGGSQREERYDVLAERITAKGLPQDQYWWYLDLRRFGSAPHAGFGLGFERMLQVLTGMGNIRDVIPFPRVPGGAEF